VLMALVVNISRPSPDIMSELVGIEPELNISTPVPVSTLVASLAVAMKSGVVTKASAVMVCSFSVFNFELQHHNVYSFWLNLQALISP
jgi:hypothetical protein